MSEKKVEFLRLRMHLFRKVSIETVDSNLNKHTNINIRLGYAASACIVCKKGIACSCRSSARISGMQRTHWVRYNSVLCIISSRTYTSSGYTPETHCDMKRRLEVVSGVRRSQSRLLVGLKVFTWMSLCWLYVLYLNTFPDVEHERIPYFFVKESVKLENKLQARIVKA